VSDQTATLSATRWRTAQTVTSHGLADCPSNLLIELSITPPSSGGLLGGLTLFAGGLIHPKTPDRHSATGVMERPV
jgi:hypothetical protein